MFPKEPKSQEKMSQKRYVLKIRDDELYVHFKPKTGEYFLDDKKVGACVFHHMDAIQFMADSGTDGLELIELPNAVTVRKAERIEEQAIRNRLNN